MTTPSDIKGDILAQCDSLYDLGVTAGKQEQADSDATVIQALRADVAAANGKTAEVQGKLDEALARIKELEGELEPPSEPAHLLIGSSFPGEQYETLIDGRAEVARLYVPASCSDVRKWDDFMRAYDDHGVRHFALSWKDTSTTFVKQACASVPDDCTFYGINHHEPEDNIKKGEFTLAQWIAWQKAHLPVIAGEGGKPRICLMQWTLEAGSGRRPADYDVSDVAGGVWFDWYPTKTGQADAALGRMQKFRTDFGFKDWGIGEFAVPKSATWGASEVAAIRTKLEATDAEAACYWPSTATGKGDYHFTPATADAWLG